jgi:hypothetical protein
MDIVFTEKGLSKARIGKTDYNVREFALDFCKLGGGALVENHVVGEGDTG